MPSLIPMLMSSTYYFTIAKQTYFTFHFSLWILIQTHVDGLFSMTDGKEWDVRFSNYLKVSLENKNKQKCTNNL